jgi:phage tail P2-like protein
VSEVLLPSSATVQERALEQATARVGAPATPLRELWNVDECPAALLPWLAWAYSLDEWDAAWTVDQQRNAIRQSVAIHRYKGTIGAVKNALAALGYEVQVQEWFNVTPAADPYTFRLLLNVSQVGISQEAMQRIQQVIQSTKNLRSHLEVIVPTIASTSEVTAATVGAIGNEITVAAYGLPTLVIQEHVIAG